MSVTVLQAPLEKPEIVPEEHSAGGLFNKLIMHALIGSFIMHSKGRRPARPVKMFMSRPT